MEVEETYVFPKVTLVWVSELLLDEICKYVISKIEELGRKPVTTDLCVGLRYTYAVVEVSGEKFIGLCYTPLEDISHSNQEVTSPSDLASDTVCDLIKSTNYVTKALAVAYLNALTSAILEIPPESSGKDLLDVMEFSSGDVVAFVGYIGPLVRRVKEVVKEVYVLERNVLRRQDALPDTAAPRVLPKANKVIVTGASIVNDTIDYILSLCRRAGEVAIVGATASLHPEPLFSAGIKYVAGFRVRRECIGDAARCIRLAGGTRELYRYGSKYVLVRS